MVSVEVYFVRCGSDHDPSFDSTTCGQNCVTCFLTELSGRTAGKTMVSILSIYCIILSNDIFAALISSRDVQNILHYP